MLQVTVANFESEVIESDQPVLVDFSAEWCGVCKMIEPLIHQVASELDGQVKVVKLDVDHEREIAVKYGVRSIPYLMFFKNGEVKDQIIGGNVTKDLIKSKLLDLSL